MATVAELERKLDDHIQSNDARFDKLDNKLTTYQIETIKEMVKNTTLLEQFGGTLTNVLSKVEVIRDKPGNRYDALKMVAGGAIIGAVITYFFKIIIP